MSQELNIYPCVTISEMDGELVCMMNSTLVTSGVQTLLLDEGALENHLYNEIILIIDKYPLNRYIVVVSPSQFEILLYR